MTKDKLITRLTPVACEEFQSRILEACQKVAATTAWLSKAPDGEAWIPAFAFEPVSRVSIPASDGTAFDLEKDRFVFLTEHYGLAPSDVGASFEPATSVSRSMASILKRIPDRRGFKFAA